MATLNGKVIPLEMLREITKSLSARDKHNLLPVSQAFHHIFASNVYEDMNLCSLRAWKVFQNFARHSDLAVLYASLVQRLSFTTYKEGHDDKIFYPLLCDTLLMLPNLKVLKLAFLSHTRMAKEFVDLVRRWGLVHGLGATGQRSAPLSCLRQLVIDGAPPLLELAHNRDLHHLRMWLDGLVESSSYIAMTFRCLNIGHTLNTLELLNVSPLQAAALYSAAAMCCPYLQALSLSHMRMNPLVCDPFLLFAGSRQS